MARTSLFRSVLTALASVIVLGAITFATLVLAFDMRMEPSGSGWRPILVFDDPDEHFDILEENRSQHYSHLLPAGPIGGDPNDATVEAYWTDFRGPDRDGRYTEQPINLDWPADGFTPLWKPSFR